MAEKTVRIRLERSLAPYHQAFGQLVALVLPTARQCARVVPFGVRRARDVGDGRQTRGVAGVARLRVAEVRRSEAHGAIRRERAALASGAGEHHDGLASIGGGDAVVLVLNDVERLVPGNLLPGIGIAALLRIALHGMQKACRIVDVVFERYAPGAQAPLGHRVVLVALDSHEPAPIVHVQLETASHRMASGWGPRTRAGNGQAVLLVSPRLADVVDV